MTMMMTMLMLMTMMVMMTVRVKGRARCYDDENEQGVGGCEQNVLN